MLLLSELKPPNACFCDCFFINVSMIYPACYGATRVALVFHVLPIKTYRVFCLD